MSLMRNIISLFLIMLLVLMPLNGCEKAPKNKDPLITIDIFSAQANFQGLQSGWFAKVVEEKFNMKLNIIAPNVAGVGDRLFQTRLAAGNLADIVIISTENGSLHETVEAGLLLDLTPYQHLLPNAMQYTPGIQSIQSLLGISDRIYALPESVSSFEPTEPSESVEPTFGPYLRWDLYMQIGSPQMETLEDLLPVLKKMQMQHPKSDSGQNTYAFSLFPDWDDNLMMFAKQPACFYGYDELGFLLNKADGSETIDILDDQSPYIRSLRFLYQANRMGLVDPDSLTNTWDTVWSKYADGAILFSPWPWLGQTAYNTIERLENGQGFMMAPIDDIEIYSYGATPQGSKFVIGIGSKTQYPERVAAFINWLYSPEGIMMNTSSEGSTSGPEGLTWMMIDGRPELTEFGIKAMLDNGTQMPEEWGGGLWGEGISQLNFKAVIPKDINPQNGFPYDFRLWESYIEFTATPVHQSWQFHMNAQSTMEYLESRSQITVAPGSGYITPAESNYIATLRSRCKAIIVDTSWKMVFAKSEAEFNALLQTMQANVKELGYDDVIAYDYAIAEQLNHSRKQLLD